LPRVSVEIVNAQRTLRLRKSAVRAFVRALLAAAGEHDKGLAVTFVDDAQMRALNLATFGKDRTTNVISFPLGGVPGDPAPLLGEVFVSAGTALAEARQAALSPETRLAQLVIHGLLHIQGYEHVGVGLAERRRMQRAEKRAYARVADLVEGKLLFKKS
jgi:probable rRNA maturation factor